MPAGARSSNCLPMLWAIGAVVLKPMPEECRASLSGACETFSIALFPYDDTAADKIR